MDNKFCTEAYIYGLESMLEEARQTIVKLSKELKSRSEVETSLRESKQGVEKRLGEIINE